MIKQLIAIRLRATFLASLTGKNKNGKSTGNISSGKVVGYSILYIFLALIFMTAVFSMSMGMGMILITEGAADAFFGIMMLASLGIIFIFGIFETKSELFDCKDNTLLLSMPISTGAIILSRIFTVLVYNYLIEAIIMIPSVLVYMMFGGSILGLIGSLLVFILIPPLATALSAGLGYIVAVITKKIKHKTFFTVLFSLAFFTLYMVGYMSLFSTSPDMGEDVLVDIDSMLESLVPIRFIGGAQLLSPVPLLILIALAVGACALAYYFISKNYIKIITGTVSTAKNVYVERASEKKSVFSALVRKEFSYLFSSANYILNGALTALIGIILGVIVIIKSSDLLGMINAFFETDEFVDVSVMAAPVAVAIVFILSASISLSYSALSLEGKSLWIIKTMPISSKTVLFAKTVPHIVVGSVSGLFLSLSIAFATSAAPGTWAFYILMPILMNVALAFLGIICNTMRPKFDFTNEVQVVKQSLPVFIATMGGLILGMVMIFVSFLMALFGLSYVFLFVFAALFVALIVAFYFIICGYAVNKLDKIQA